MAVFALTSEYVAINGVDQSANFKSATVTVDVAELDSTDFASDGWVEVIGGLKSGQLILNAQDDIADGAIDDDLWALLGTVVSFELRGTSASVGTSNPKYTGNVLVKSHTFGGDVGSLAMKSLTWPTSGAVTRAEA